jgi:predicted amidohydrolase
LQQRPQKLADTFTVAVAQTAPHLGDVEGNLLGIEQAVSAARAKGARLVLLPELALTGYALQDAVAAVALRADSPRLAEIATLSQGCALVLGFVEEGGRGTFHNSALIAVDGRIVAIHRKRHLPTYALFDEGRFFKPGRGITLFDLNGWRLGILICEEAWYPQTVHEVADAGAEALLVLANGPGRGVLAGERWQTQDAWRELVRFYARLYLVPVFLANRTGVEEGLFFGGCSAVVEAGGRVAAEGPLFDEALLFGELSRAALRRARMRSPGRPVEPPPAFDTLLFPPAAEHAHR